MKERKRFSYLLDHAEEIILVPAFAIMLFINVSNVLARYVIHISWAFTEELCLISFVYVTFFGASLAVRRGQHLGFDVIFQKASKPVQLVLETFITISVIMMMCIAFYFGIKVCQNQATFNSKTPALHIPMWICSGCVPVSAVCIIIRTIQMYVLFLRGYRNKEEEEGEVKC